MIQTRNIGIFSSFRTTLWSLFNTLQTTLSASFTGFESEKCFWNNTDSDSKSGYALTLWRFQKGWKRLKALLWFYWCVLAIHPSPFRIHSFRCVLLLSSEWAHQRVRLCRISVICYLCDSFSTIRLPGDRSKACIQWRHRHRCYSRFCSLVHRRHCGYCLGMGYISRGASSEEGIRTWW